MKIWEKYTDYLMAGEWHIHTNYTDGKNTIIEYCKKAIELEIPLIAFTEHVRKELDYDFNKFLEDIEKTREIFKYDLIILSGCEVKVLPNGELDIKDYILKEVDYTIFAYHGNNKNNIESLNNVLRNEYIDTWSHPITFLSRNSISDKEFKEILILMKRLNILFEINKKYPLPGRWKNIIREYDLKLVRGSDIHSKEEMIKEV